jgi:SAM-dependent methyltransferase/uncharacterized protein YbaR (Trm112 family)
MRDALLEIVRCPTCQLTLALADGRRDGQQVVAGTLSCVRCGGRWPIVEGVPDFVGARGAYGVEQTTGGFATNWRRYSDVILAQPALNDELFRDWIEPLQPELFEGKQVLEAGCGMGRWLLAAAPHGPSALVGFDYSEVVHAAYENTRHLKNVHIVRADIFRMPFLPAFDVCYSIGVVHHTPDPEGAFAALLQAVLDGGALHVWVYGEENNGWLERVVSPLRRVLTSRLPDAALYAVSKVLTLQLALGARAYAKAFPEARDFSYDAYLRHLTKYPRRYLEHIVYDHLVPQLAQYLPRAELERWAVSRSLSYSLTSRNNNSWRLVVARTPAALVAVTSSAR